MSLFKLSLAASLVIAPAAFAKNNSAKTSIASPVVSSSNNSKGSDTSDGYKGKGSNPPEEKQGYGDATGSNVRPPHIDRTPDDVTYYVPDTQHQNDPSYYSGAGYTNYTNREPVSKVRGEVELGLRYAVGKGLVNSPDLVGASVYGRASHPTQRFAAEVSLDTLSSGPTSNVEMKQGSLLLGYLLFLNPDGKLKPYGSMGLGGTWHGLAGEQNIFGALALGVGLDVNLGESLRLNIDSRLIADSEPSEGPITPSAASSLNNSQEFVVSSAGLSFRW